MKVLVVGGGGREHAIVKKLKENPQVTTVYAIPGNGGIALDAQCFPEIGAKDLDGVSQFCKTHPVDFAVVAPDDPLVLGMVDRLESEGIPCFGPRANAAIIEGSKVFSKNLMKKYNIPTAGSETFTDFEKAKTYVESLPCPIVIKADGLALGKGVVIAQTTAEAVEALHGMMCDKMFGDSGNSVLVEEFLTGPEVSVLAFTDGETVSPMVSSMDHKRIGDNDTGLNTGGMGTVAPNPFYTKEVAEQCMQTIFLPTIRAMKAEGRTFKGCLYFGLMLTPNGPKVIEYNCRFGDPETQVVLPLLKTDLLTVMQAVRNGTLKDVNVEFSTGAACCVVMASKGYPQKYESGYEITLPTTKENEYVFVAGAKMDNGVLKTAGGRVLGAVSTAPTLRAAVDGAYALSEKITFANAYKRFDIGKKALSQTEKN